MAMRLAVPKGTRHRTKGEFVYRTLREAIVKCELAPGERLVIDELARRLEVSSIPVREALQLLQSEGLVDLVPHVGATVASLGRESVAEVFTVMEGLESVAARVAGERAGAEDLDALAELVAAMDRALAAGAHEQWAEANTRFHVAISRLSGMPMLQEMMERVLDRWDRVRRFFFAGVLVHRAHQAQQEHHALLDAMRARDFGRLEETIRAHNRGALADYTAFLESVPHAARAAEAAE
jgi:DNA-binding GntR family transcriptional regulator